MEEREGWATQAFYASPSQERDLRKKLAKAKKTLPFQIEVRPPTEGEVAADARDLALLIVGDGSRGDDTQELRKHYTRVLRNYLRVIISYKLPTIYPAYRLKLLAGGQVDIAAAGLSVPRFYKLAIREVKKHGADLFKRCDECGVKSRRRTLYLLSDGRFLGGTCATNLNLAKKFGAALRSVSSFLPLLSDPGSMAEEHWKLQDMPDKRESAQDFVTTAKLWIDLEGYESRGVTRRRVEDSLDSDQTLGALFRLYKEKTGRDGTKGLQDWFEGFEKWILAIPDSDEFGRKMRVAYATGDKTLRGVLAYAPAAYARATAKKKERTFAKKAPKASWWDERETEVAAPQELLNSWGTQADMAAILGVKEAAIAKLFATQKVTKTLHAKLVRAVPGYWEIYGIRSYEGQYGVTHYAKCARVSDGVRLTISRGNSFVDLEDTKFAIRSCTVKDGRDDDKYGKTITRASLVVKES